MVLANETRVRWLRIERETSEGLRYALYEPIMPRIPDELLNSVVYLFKDQKCAREGKGDGGTGFLVRYSEDGFEYWYVVTNLHVVGNGCTTLRINTADGGIATINIPRKRWVDHPQGDDVSVASLDLEIPSVQAALPLFWNSVCPTTHRLQELDIGVGDDVFMLGRFVGHSGRQQNQPLARFGNLAMMDSEKVKDGRGMSVDAYLAEMRSLPGFSGSPVFVWVPPATLRGARKMTSIYGGTTMLLGIDTGHKEMTHRVRDKATEKPSHSEQYVRQNSGVAIVAPYYKIQEVIEGDALMKKRKESNSDFDPEAAVSDIAHGEVDEPGEFDRFEDLTGKLLKVPKKELDEKRQEQEK